MGNDALLSSIAITSFHTFANPNRWTAYLLAYQPLYSPTADILSLLSTLLHGMLRQHQLVAYIRSLVSQSFLYTPYYGGKAPKIPVSQPGLEEPLAFVEKTRVSHRQTWLEELQNGTINVFVAVLSFQPLCLSYLFIGSDFKGKSDR